MSFKYKSSEWIFQFKHHITAIIHFTLPGQAFVSFASAEYRISVERFCQFFI